MKQDAATGRSFCIFLSISTGLQEAQQRLQQAQSRLETGRAERREASARTAALEHEAEAAEEQALSARRRLPGLEADKKAAAVARVSLPPAYSFQSVSFFFCTG